MRYRLTYRGKSVVFALEELSAFSTYKMLFYELVEAVEGEGSVEKKLAGLGPFPDDLPDSAVQ